jgi:hypothetical protein
MGLRSPRKVKAFWMSLHSDFKLPTDTIDLFEYNFGTARARYKLSTKESSIGMQRGLLLASGDERGV